MTPTRCISMISLLLMALTGAAPVAAQATGDRTAIGEAALAAWQPFLTLLLRDGPPNILGNDRFIGGMTLSVLLVRVVRINGTWTALCFAVAATDFIPPADQVEAKCAASPLGRGE